MAGWALAAARRVAAQQAVRQQGSALGRSGLNRIPAGKCCAAWDSNFFRTNGCPFVQMDSQMDSRCCPLLPPAGRASWPRQHLEPLHIPFECLSGGLVVASCLPKLQLAS